MSERQGTRRLLDARTERALTQRLRAMPEDRAFRTVRRLIRLEPKVGLRIAGRILQRPQRIEELLREGLRISNESTIRFWLEAAAQRLGPARMIQLVREQIATAPEIADRALYWLPHIARANDDAQRALGELRATVSPGNGASTR